MEYMLQLIVRSSLILVEYRIHQNQKVQKSMRCKNQENAHTKQQQKNKIKKTQHSKKKKISESR